MSFRKTFKSIGMICACGMMMIAIPTTVKAAELAPANQTSTEMVAKINTEVVSVYAEQDEKSAVIAQASAGTTYDVLASTPSGWVKVAQNGQEGYIKLDDNATLAETTVQTQDPEVSKRQQVVDYALQFVGGRYVYGGSDPNTGADCSGFTSYVMRHSAGVSMNRSSTAQSTQGRGISAAEIQPGDLVFYGNGRSINHVAIYIGDGQIVHASTERTGIKISEWTYRSPVKIVSVL